MGGGRCGWDRHRGRATRGVRVARPREAVATSGAGRERPSPFALGDDAEDDAGHEDPVLVHEHAKGDAAGDVGRQLLIGRRAEDQ